MHTVLAQDHDASSSKSPLSSHSVFLHAEVVISRLLEFFRVAMNCAGHRGRERKATSADTQLLCVPVSIRTSDEPVLERPARWRPK